MKTLHVDTGREMQGGQWQVRYLVERLEGATLLVPAGSPLLGVPGARVLTLTALAREARRADLVHAHDAKAHTMAIVAGGAPLVVSRRVGFAVRSRWKYRRAARFLAVSKFVAERLAEAGVEKGRIRVVYDGVPVPERESARTGGVVALSNKCAEIAREAVESAGAEIKFVTDLWQDLSTARVFLYASEMEGLGSAALAAMAAGVPVIATPVGGLPEIVEHERTGLLADVKELANAVRRLLNEPEFAAEMGRRGRDAVIEKFSVDAMVKATMSAYQEVVQ
jgi:Glycosyl transferases group 1/Glycosyltransferase Family 4